jgi:hypothetical protein
LTPTKAAIPDVARRFGDAVKELFGIEPPGLTADEAAYLRNFKDADALRRRWAKAESEREHRLHPKGIEPDGEVGEGAEQAPDGLDDYTAGPNSAAMAAPRQGQNGKRKSRAVSIRRAQDHRELLRH